MPDRPIDRRRFVTLGTGAMLLPFTACSTSSAPPSPRRTLRMGLIADLHHGLDPRAQQRVEDFVAAANARAADMIVQLGDFNYAEPDNRPCLDVWESFAGDRHHVLGNHDMDKHDKAHVLETWQMPARYYAFDRAGWHFVVLDRNHVKQGDDYLPYGKGNYFGAKGSHSHADPEQLEWLAANLRRTTRPTIVLVHQGLGVRPFADSPAEYPADDGRAPIEAVLAAANAESLAAGRGPKVVACFCGHEHLDRHELRDGVHYVWVNSASYYWVGGEYGRMAPYADALYAFVDLYDDCLVIHGRESTFDDPSPEARGFPRWREVTAAQRDRRLGIG
ncbi:MAG: metallophosphoesterase [Planctomycetes bacterium]|nr:metallophosphoesterase [Planctomycetota bacterium]